MTKQTHLYATPCRCEEPFGDERDMTCGKCGRQVYGVPIPATRTLGLVRDESTFARPTRKYRPAA